MSENYTMSLHRSRSGLPCLWECGGGLTNTGYARLITSPTGKPKHAIYVRTHGDRCCGNHALIPVKVGDCVVSVDRHWDRVSIMVEHIIAISGDTATVERTDDLISYDAIQAAVAKSQHYHCREPYYIRQLFERQEMPGEVIGNQTLLAVDDDMDDMIAADNDDLEVFEPSIYYDEV